MSREVFISYNYADKPLAHNVKRFFQPAGGFCQGTAHFVIPVTETLPDAKIYELLSEQMSKCDVALFVIGDNSHDRPWVDDEVKLAQSKNLPRVAVQLPDTRGGLPAGLRAEGVEPLPWSETAVCAALNRLPNTR